MKLVLALIAFALPPHPSLKNRISSNLASQANQAREQNRIGDAVRLYGQALEVQPSWKEGLWYMGTLLYQQDQFASARDVLRRFVAEEPRDRSRLDTARNERISGTRIRPRFDSLAARDWQPASPIAKR